VILDTLVVSTCHATMLVLRAARVGLQLSSQLKRGFGTTLRPQNLRPTQVLRRPQAPSTLRLLVGTHRSIHVRGQHYEADHWTNTPNSIISLTSRDLITEPRHPLQTLRKLIESSFPNFTHISRPDPVVSVYENFDSLSFAPDHPGRSRSDTYYVNKDLLLRTHTSAHEVEIFKTHQDGWTLTADVYRRDEIDATHYPAFHQTEGARTFSTTPEAMKKLAAENAAMRAGLAKENIVIEDCAPTSAANPMQDGHNPEAVALIAENLKLHLNRMLLTLFGPRAAMEGEPLRVRYIEAFFPFTAPSYEVEVFWDGKWLELLGCGVVQQATLDNAAQEHRIGWAFGLGVERIAMVLFGIPDIRLFWSEDPRFLGQFEEGKVTQFKPYSRYPPCFKDVSFWLPQEGLHDNDFCDLVREQAGDLAESVELVRLLHV
jgi:phenylalanyl-tRNA synthetase alpha chain